MIITLIKSTQMFSLTLPQRVKGQYWLTDLDEKGRLRQLASIEAIDEKWFLKENKMVKIFDTEGNVLKNHILTPSSFLYLKIENSDERVILFAENIDYTRQTLTRIVAKEPAVFTIGRDPNNNFCFNNRFVSNEHARLMFDGEAWSICDLASKNGTYVNGYRIETKKLKPGDFIYIMGLKMVVGSNYIALNNPDEKLKIKSDSIGIGRTQVARNSDENIPEQPEKQFFSRSPRFRKEIEHAEVKIDPPPPLEKEETVPLALMIGPSITMGMTSVSTGLISLINGINGGNMASVIPTLLMSVSMLLGTVLWPLLTKRHEKKQRIANENRRQEKYLEYLSEIGEKFKRLSREQSDILNENLTSQGECADRVMMEKSNLWERVLGQADFLKLRLGIGTIEMDAEVKYPEKKFTMDDDILQNAMLTLAEEPKVLHNVPISLSLTENAAVGFYGEKAATYNFMKSVILQLVALHSYDELKIMILLDKSDEDEWAFTKYIPHFWSDDKRIRFFASDDDEVKEISAFMEKNILVRQDKYNRSYADFAPYYVLISASGKLSRKCETLSKLLSSKGNIGFSALFIGEKFNDFPKETKTVIHVNGRNTKLYDKDNTTGAQIVFDAEHADESIFGRVSEKLANIELDVNGQQYTMPSMITFLEMFNVGKVEYLNSLTRWRENNPTKTLQTPVGVNSEGELFNLDLHEKYHGPHGLVAGMTGSGKSEFIITYILSMAVNYHPDEVSFILIDYKGGGLAGAFENADRCIKLPHLAGTITNLDGASIKRSLISIQSELRRRQSIFNDALRITNEGTMDIYKYQQLYRDKVVTEPLPHLFIISDEFAELKTQQPDFMDQLISAARIGRSLGIHLILATQKPSGVVDDQIWSNSKFRVCLKVQERADSQDMIKCPDAAELTQTGRFYLQVGYNELFALGQSAWCGADYIPTDVIEKTVDTSIQVGMGIFELNKGYFDGNEKMTAEECLNAINRMFKVEANSQYEKGELKVSYKDNVQVIDKSVKIYDYKEFDAVSTESIDTDGGERPKTVFCDKEINTETEFLDGPANRRKISFQISKAAYQQNIEAYEVGKIVVMPKAGAQQSLTRGLSYSKPISVEITDVNYVGVMVTITGYDCDAEQFLKDEPENQGINAKKTISPVSNPKDEDEKIQTIPSKDIPEGVSIKPAANNNGITVTFGHTFKINDPIYSKQEWRNPAIDPSIELSATISDFNVSVHNVGKLLLSKKAVGNVKLSYKTEFTANAKAEFRYSPANNGNGGLKIDFKDKKVSGNFFANIKNARFTGSSAGGSKSIKLAQVIIPLGSGFTIGATLYLEIRFDGTINLKIMQSNAYELTIKKTSWFSYRANTANLSTTDTDSHVNANVTIALALNPNVGYFGDPIIDGEIKAKFEIDAEARFFSHDEKPQSGYVYVTKYTADEWSKSGDLKYCIGIDYNLSFEGNLLTEKSKVGKFVIKTLKAKSVSMFKPINLWSHSSHFEDGKYMSNCTRDGSGQTAVEVNGQGKIYLEKYKSIVREGDEESVSITSLPLSDKDIKNKGGIKVSIADPNIAEVRYNKTKKTISIVAKHEGSTEITVIIERNKKKTRFYEQKISVTVEKGLENQSVAYFDKKSLMDYAFYSI